MPLLSRRDFLKDATLSLALLAGSGAVFNPLHPAWAANETAGKEFWLLCDTPQPLDNLPGVTVTNPGSVNGLEVASGQSFKIDLPFFGHTVTQSPAHPHQAVTFEKWGRRGALLDLREKRVISTIEADPGYIFFGHAAFIAGGSIVVTSEDTYGHKKKNEDTGQLFLRDAATLKPIRKIPSYGQQPHDCQTLDEGKTFLIANCGQKNPPRIQSGIAWVEAASGKLLHRTAIDLDRNVHMGHMAVASDGWLCLGGLRGSSKEKASLLAFVSPGGKVLWPEIPESVIPRMKGEALSLTLLGSGGLVAATLPKLGVVLVLDYKTQSYVDSIPLHDPKGILSDLTMPGSEPGMIVSSSTDKNLLQITLPPGGKPAVRVESAAFGGNGSHMSRIYI